MPNRDFDPRPPRIIDGVPPASTAHSARPSVTVATSRIPADVTAYSDSSSLTADPESPGYTWITGIPGTSGHGIQG